MLEEVRELMDAIVREIRKVVVGLDDAIKAALTALFSGGHILIEGPPGLGKTTLARAFAASIGGSFSRVQMTPDTLPADIIGTVVYDFRSGTFRVRKGPIFANVVLVDEINRAPPRTQSALLQAMQELKVTIEGVEYELPKPFIVFATQVPTGLPGTYPLPETALDRFAISIRVSYPSRDVELRVVSEIDRIDLFEVGRAASPEDIVKCMETIKRSVYVSEEVIRYIVDVVRALREFEDIALGPSTRAAIWLMKCSRVHAVLEGRDYVVPDDVKFLAKYVLQHRIWLKPEVEAEGISPTDLIEKVLTKVPVPKGGKP